MEASGEMNRARDIARSRARKSDLTEREKVRKRKEIGKKKK